VALGDIPAVTAAFLSVESQVGEGLRSVGTRLRLGTKGKAFRTLAMTSSVEGDGKTSVAVGLATALAHAGQRVLLIDADLRRRDVGATLKLDPAPGLAEWLENAQDPLPVRKVRGVGFHVLSAGIVSCRPELLGAPRLVQLLNAGHRQFDTLLLDCAPLLPVADTLALRDQVDGFLLVVRARHSPREAVARASTLLGGRRIVGVVMNGYRSRFLSSRGFGYAYSPSYRYGGPAKE